MQNDSTGETASSFQRTPRRTPSSLPSLRSRRRSKITTWGVIVVLAAIVAGASTAALALSNQLGQPRSGAPAASLIDATPSPRQTIVLPVAPLKPTAEALAVLPLAFFDAVIPGLLDGSSVSPVNRWTTATPIDELTALYESPRATAAPIAAIGRVVPNVNTATVVAVFGVSGEMILISTPSRNTVPGVTAPTAASSTFAWARRADFTLTPVVRTVVIDNQTSTISIQDVAGTVTASEVARLGSSADPTPTATFSYIQSSYVDRRITYTQGHSITLTGAHSPTIADYGGNSGLTALHFYPDPSGSSHGCVRISAAMTAALAALPVGTPVIFT